MYFRLTGDHFDTRHASIPSLVSMREQARIKLRGRDSTLADAKKLIKRALFAEVSAKIEAGLQCYPDDLQLTQLRASATETAAKYNSVFEKASSLLEAGRLQYVDRELSAARAICTQSEGVKKLKAELGRKNDRRDADARAAMQYAEAAEFSRAKEHIEKALRNFPGDAVLESRQRDIMAKAERFPSMVAKAEQLALEGNFSGAIRTANAALGLCKKAAPALDALSNAKKKARNFPRLQSAANRLRSDGNDFHAAKNKVTEALAVCPQSQHMLNTLAEIEKANRLFKAVLARHSFDKLEVGGTVFVLLESHVPPTVFFASVSQLNFMRQTISVAFPDLKGVEHEFDVAKFAQLVNKQKHPVVSSPPPMAPAYPQSYPTPSKPAIPPSAVLPQPAPTATARTPPAVAAAAAPVTTQSSAAAPRTAMSLYASRVMGEWEDAIERSKLVLLCEW